MYEDFYGFSGRPFQLTPDPEFYFESATHRKALSYLGYGLAQAEGFIVITGEVGAGKSTLVAHLLQELDRGQTTAGSIVTSALDGSEMVHVAAQAFGLAVAGKDKASALKAIETFLHAEARAGRRCLLIVDEAQNLSIAALEELRMLSNFHLGAHPLLQTLLLGQPEFRNLLANDPALEQLRQRVIANHHLEPMTADEVGPYIEHRLAKVGWTGKPAFDVGAYATLADATGGIPRRINQVVARVLLLGAIEQRERVDAEMVAAVLDDLSRDAPASVGVAAPAAEAASLATNQGAGTDIATQAKVDLEEALRRRDVLIAELQEAVLELSDASAGARTAPAAGQDQVLQMLTALDQRLTGIEGRLSEQEQTLRHTLTMLIEWIEDGDPQARAA